MCGRSNRKFEFLFRPPKRRIIGSFIVFIAVITESMFVALESLMNLNPWKLWPETTRDRILPNTTEIFQKIL